MIKYRLVLQQKTRHWGSDSLEITDRWYILQAFDDLKWTTCDVVLMEHLTEVEIQEIHDVLGDTV